jgi:hypothetical protein
MTANAPPNSFRNNGLSTALAMLSLETSHPSVRAIVRISEAARSFVQWNPVISRSRSPDCMIEEVLKVSTVNSVWKASGGAPGRGSSWMRLYEISSRKSDPSCLPGVGIAEVAVVGVEGGKDEVEVSVGGVGWAAGAGEDRPEVGTGGGRVSSSTLPLFNNAFFTLRGIGCFGSAVEKLVYGCVS